MPIESKDKLEDTLLRLFWQILLKKYRKMKEYRLEDFLSSNVIDYTKDYNIVFENGITKKRGILAHNGDVVGEIKLTEQKEWKFYNKFVGTYKLIAPDTAVYDFMVLSGMCHDYIPCKKFIDEKIVICKSYDDFQEMAENVVKDYCGYEILDDVFNGEKRILWKHWVYYKYYSRDDFELRFIPVTKGSCQGFPSVKLDNAKEQFVFQYDKKWFPKHKFVKGDVFHFVFENNRHLEYQLKTSAANASKSDYKQVSFTLLPQDIKLFSSENLIAIRCEFQNGDAPLDLKKENELASLTFKLYFQKYIKALSECGVDVDAVDHDNESMDEAVKEPSRSIKEESCFVYLMKDESNGYHKIGISNKPEYRERTLQSEKPTIVLLCAKEFPTRIIAEAIEAALHKAFCEKRIRGEWFDLSDKDVMEITMTLR